MARATANRPERRRTFVSLPSGRFAPVYRQGTRQRCGGVEVISAAGEAGPPQVGIVAGRGVGNAVERNRTKRRLRHAVGRMTLRPDTAYVVVASPEAATLPFDRLMADLAGAIAAIEEREE